MLFLITIVFLALIIRGLLAQPILTNLEMGFGNFEPINNPVLLQEDFATLDSINVTGEETKPKVFAFYQLDGFPNKENNDSLLGNIDSIDILVPDWFLFDKEGSIIEKSDLEIDLLATENNVQIVPSISLSESTTADDLHDWLSNPAIKDKIIKNLLNKIKTKGYKGLHLNLSAVHWDDRELYNEFVTDLYNTFHQSNLLLTVFVRLGDETYDTKFLTQVSDHIMANVFDQHIEKDEPGPLASFQWTQETLDQYQGETEKLVPLLANYGYAWNLTTNEPAIPYDFTSLMEMVNRQKFEIQWEDHLLNPYIRYKKDKEEHVIWLLDGTTFYNQMKLAQSKEIPSIGVWNLGSEDPSIWKLLVNDKVDALDLETIPNRVSTAVSGDGDFLKVTMVEAEGKRNLEIDHHFITKATYEKYPTPYLLEKYGMNEKKVAISFDDGPNPKYTGRVLEILDQYNVKAAFFLIGQNASMYPELTKKIYDEGHEIGSHTYTHKDIISVSDQQLEFELNSTQRVIQGITGHSVIMFRPPYLLLNDEPNELPSKKVLDRFLTIQEMGYTVVSSTIDPRDWNGGTAEQIFNDTIKRIQNGRTILFHDSGGDRNPTIEALPRVIEWLKENDYSIVPVSELVGLERKLVMPDVQEAEKTMVPLFQFGSSFNAMFITFARNLLSVLIGIGLVRLVILVIFSYKQKRKSEKLVFDEDKRPFVTVLIAAYNEETVIGNTIQSILASSYPHFEILIVDDGSKDKTASIVEAASKKYPNIRLLRKENGGKASALNLGIQKNSSEIIVTLDADTLIAEDTIALIIRHLENPEVGAVSGNVKIGNRKNLLTWWQHIEYVTGFNLEKRAFDELDSITVVPGAIGAWRKSALLEVGLFEEDTLAEDTDVTMKLLRKGYKIRSEVAAIAYTEAPEDLKSFTKQRYRWTFGILQCIWKHRTALFNMKNKKLGFLAMPNMIFQYVLLATAPLVDYILILALISGNMSVIYFYLAFLLADSSVSIYAFNLEKEKKKPLLTLFIQRIVYRQFFTIVVWRSFVNAIKGQLQGWNKLQRTGHVT
ncbi:glycosyltransferase [Jeotgalibaca sp. A127]|uniref:glycosyltransferase n=1 Tax=Jeotgalibaca sp. A127 TaxID=3457324 RepID=UPI003FD0F79F